MEIVKAFNSNELHTEIVIKGTPENPLFRASDIGNILEITNIRTSIKDFDTTEKVVHTVNTHGGNQEVTFLTEKGLYKVLFKSRKPIAEQFQNWVCEVVKEIRLTGQYKLNKEVEELKHQLEEKESELHTKERSYFLSTHTKFLQLFNDNKVVYVMLLKYADPLEHPNKKYIIKIGKTERLPLRLKEIATTYMVKEPLIIDAYESNNISKLENCIHNHLLIKSLHYTCTTVHQKTATETYIVNDEELGEIKNAIKTLQDTLSSDDTIDKQLRLAELQLKNNELQLKRSELQLQTIAAIQRLNDDTHPTLTKIANEIRAEVSTDNLEVNEEIIEETKEDASKNIASIDIRPRAVKGSHNPEIYQYQPSDLSLVKRHNSQIELQREKPNISLNSLRNAIKNNTIYLDYRWVSVKRGEEPVVQPTKKSVIKSHDTVKYIVRLNDSKTKILNAFASARDGIEYMKREHNIKSTVHSFNRAITTGGLQFGFFWNYFDSCSAEMQKEFLSHSSLPTYSNPLGITIVKRCPTTGSTIDSFHSKMEVFKMCGISTTKLNKLLENGEVYQGYSWSIVE